MRDHRKLRAFELADQFVVAIYHATADFPKAEQFGLTSQMRRCAVSVPANIVEGSARRTQADYLRFLEIAFGSLRELGYFIDLSNRLGFLLDEARQELDSDYAVLSRTLGALIQSLRTK